MKLNLVPARTGAQWVRTGLRAFATQPLAFVSLFFFFMGLVSIVSQIPLAGAIFALMLLPTMTLGLMAAAAEAAGPIKPGAGAVFRAAITAVRSDVKPMVVLGALYAGLFLVVMAISAIADGGQFARVYLLGGELSRELAESTEFQVALWIAMGLYLPLSLAFWHAPALVHWHHIPPAKSLFFSFVACFKNFGALTVFGLVWVGVFIAAGFLLSIIATVMVALGASGGAAAFGGAVMIGGALVMAAMFFTSTWFTFRDSFQAD
ncbi:MAG: hypothetical protein KKC79_14835 [Gammaproteobacteria bacterium]|nr:hypothetical protein [Gammaproteobacteria bacterium]MBU1444208.1 hypothetical protein [Gammaproteobacteria bacterium]MBU2286315.1 hypothetical protein [Gammaproteobacteria bacterium]MBU2409911.1 hypothetical protein [Gammaproteobacteria bacterium]